MGMVTHISIHKRNDKLELTCLFTKYKGKAHRIYSDCNFESEEDTHLRKEAFKQCVEYHMVHKFNEWVEQGERSREDQPEVVPAPPLARAGGADMEACMPDAPLRANAHN